MTFRTTIDILYTSAGVEEALQRCNLQGPADGVVGDAARSWLGESTPELRPSVPQRVRPGGRLLLMAESIPINVLGMRVSGDLGGITIYTSMRGGKVAYPIDHPKKPPSADQLAHRDRFRWAQAAWSALSPGEKATLEDACRLLALSLTGQNLYISCAMRRTPETYATVARQAKMTFPPLPDDA